MNASFLWMILNRMYDCLYIPEPSVLDSSANNHVLFSINLFNLSRSICVTLIKLVPPNALMLTVVFVVHQLYMDRNGKDLTETKLVCVQTQFN